MAGLCDGGNEPLGSLKTSIKRNWKRNGEKAYWKTIDNDETVEAIRRAFFQSPKKSVRKCARPLGLPKTTVHRALKKRLHLIPYKLQLLYLQFNCTGNTPLYRTRDIRSL
ncbi:hypothetical protein ANN_22375 [Periplaneta americana]|uniref:Uncharacterized protein n=1 Tax=Periplaneta americana TaxID=6978 RepID=A0ABQ8S855_PERAM|nr:hypothetical protein ANN_22375 [Periplaneta americana]